jgi:hypothetical protein
LAEQNPLTLTFWAVEQDVGKRQTAFCGLTALSIHGIEVFWANALVQMAHSIL